MCGVQAGKSCYYTDALHKSCGRDSSVGIATRYGLDGPVIESRWEPRISAPVQTGPRAHPASCTMGTGSLPGGKARRMRWAGHVARMGDGRGVHKVLVGKPDGKRPVGRPRRRWEDNIKMDLQEVGKGCGDWMELAEDRDRWRALVGTVMNLRVP